MDIKETLQILVRARAEIEVLRRQNEILRAKEEVLEIFKATLIPERGTVMGFGEDIRYPISQLIVELEDELNRKTEE